MKHTNVLLVLPLLLVANCGTITRNSARSSEELHVMLSTEITDINDVVASFPKNVAEVELLAQVAMAQAQERLNALLTIAPEGRTFANTVQALDIAGGCFGEVTSVIHLLESTHPDKAMRDACQKTIIQLQHFSVDAYTTKPIYQAFKDYLTYQGAREARTPEEQYYLDETMRGFKHAGLELPDDELDAVKALRKEIDELVTKFQSNISDDTTTLEVSPEGLAGVTPGTITTFKKTDDGKRYVLRPDYPTISEVMAHCSVSATRKRLNEAFLNRAYPVNQPVLEQLIAKRDDLAHKLGFASYAELEIDGNMAENPKRINKFLDGLIERARDKGQAEFEKLKANLPAGVTLDDQGRINSWDYGYAFEQMKQKLYAVDDRAIAEYFPVDKAVQGVFDIYQKFLNLKFKLSQPPWAWHEEVQVIEVRSGSDDCLVGYVFIDLYPREAKYSHACCHGLIHPLLKTNDDGTERRTVATAAVIANFPRARNGQPALLKHGDVETFFHEFGHAMHFLLSATKLMGQAGYSVKFDFVEMPSQIFEEWMFDPELLKNISSHYKTGKPLSDDLIANIIRIKQIDSGYFVLRQASFSKLSLELYGPGTYKDIGALANSLSEELIPYVARNPNTHMFANFGHLAGYASQYYTYLWSKVFALDVFDQLKTMGLTSPEAGQKFIKDILGRGGSVDPNIMLQDFLGRPANQDAFFKDLGM